MKVAVTGASGFVGRRLLSRLFDNDTVRVFTRTAQAAAATRFPTGAKAVEWDPVLGPPPAGSLDDVDAIVHLAGESVGQRWSRAVKTRIRDSRILGTMNLVSGIAQARVKPRVLVSASAIGFYGPRGDEALDETAAAGSDFLADVCAAWEKEGARAETFGSRSVLLRIGIVLGAGGGALARMLLPFRLGVGGPLGSGKQWMSWIHLDDLVSLILLALRTESLRGPVNATAPEPVTNKEFSRTLGRVLRRPAFLPTPGFPLRLLLGEFADVLLTGQRVLPRKAEAAGLQFRFPQLEPALRDILVR